MILTDIIEMIDEIYKEYKNKGKIYFDNHDMKEAELYGNFISSLIKLKQQIFVGEKMTDQFIKLTAKDYDIDIEDVKYIIEKYPDTYQEELERFIKERAKNE